MTRWWREQLTRRRAAVAAALLLIVLLVGGSALVFWPRSGSGTSTPTASPTPGEVAAATATPSETPTPTASPSPTETPSPTPTASPTATPAPTKRPATPRPALADLTGKGGGVGTNNTAKCGVPNTVWVNVTNRGTATAPAGVRVKIQPTLGDQYTWEIPTLTSPIAPGKTVRAEMLYQPRSPCRASSGTVYFEIDWGRAVVELSESNNFGSFAFTAIN
jgi:hypothetical protein